MRRMQRILDRVGATPAQRDQIRAIWTGLRPQLRAERVQHKSLRQQMVAALTAPTINAAEVERLRKLSMASADKVSALFTQGMVASAQVLTPEQRKLAGEELAKGRGHHQLGRVVGVTWDARRLRAARAGSVRVSVLVVRGGPRAEDSDLVARDLAVFWHPCSQMRDYREFPPLGSSGARGARLRLDGRPRDPRRDLQLVVQGARPRPPAAARRRCARSRTRSSTSSPPTPPARRWCACASGCWRRRTACRRRRGARPRRRGARPGTSARCSWPTTAPPPSRSRSRWRCRRRRSAGRRGGRASRRSRTRYHGETGGHAVGRRSRPVRGAVPRALLSRASGSSGLPYRRGPGGSRAGSTPAPSGPRIEAALDAQADTLAAIVYEPVLQAAGGMLFFSPDLLRRLRALGRRARRLPDRRRDRGRAWGAWARCWPATSPTGRAALDGGAARLRGAVEGADRGRAAAVGGADDRRDLRLVRRRLRRTDAPSCTRTRSPATRWRWRSRWRCWTCSRTTTCWAAWRRGRRRLRAAMGAVAADAPLPAQRARLRDGGGRRHPRRRRAGRWIRAGAPAGASTGRRSAAGALLRPLGDTMYLFPPLTTTDAEIDEMAAILGARAWTQCVEPVADTVR